MKYIGYFWLAGLIGALIQNQSCAAEPLMDTSLFVTARIGAMNSVKMGNFAQALKGEELALQIAQDQYGPTSLSLVPILNDKGVLQWSLAQYRDSEEDFKWGLALLEKNLGPDDPKVADSLDLLAALYIDLNRLEEAQLLEKRALALRAGVRPPNLEALSHSQDLLGRIELGLKKDAQAQTLFQEAQKNPEKFSKPDSSFSIDLWRDLAQAYSAEQNFPAAQSCLEKALETAQRNFAANSAEVADGMMALADFYRGHGPTEKSRSLYESALKIVRQFVGTNYDYEALPNMKRLARAYQAVGGTKSSGDFWGKIVQAEKSVFGSQHPRVALDLLQSAEVESALGQKGKAKADLKESLSILEHFFQEDHPLVVQAKGLLEELSKK